MLVTLNRGLFANPLATKTLKKLLVKGVLFLAKETLNRWLIRAFSYSYMLLQGIRTYAFDGS